MPNSVASRNIEQLLAEADELIQQINSDVINDMQEEHRLQFEIHAQNLKKIKSEAINDMQEEHRLQFEKHAQNLKKIKSEVQGKIEKKTNSGAEGMHEAIQDIVKAMLDLKNKLF